jgi:hypothetical protein
MDRNSGELEKILQNTHAADIDRFLEDNKDSMIDGDRSFSDYIREKMKTKGVLQQEVFLLADIPERYGYKLISGEKHTRQRDVILRICYATGLSLEETQKALKLYEMPQLYAKIPRDAVLMICFNERPGSIIEVNGFLKKNGMEPLRSSGVQE